MRFRVPFIILSCLVIIPSFASASLFDHSVLDTILSHYVDDQGRVNYESIQLNSLSALDSYFERMADADLAGWSNSEALAFWINAFNARVLYLVAQKPQLRKVSEDFELFNQPFKIAGRNLTLNDIRFRIIRGTFNPDNKQGPIEGLTISKPDFRADFALADGTLSGPRLRSTACTAETLEDLLYNDSKLYVNASEHVAMSDGKLKLSSALKWYAKDFEDAGGVAQYLSQELSPDKRGDAEPLTRLLASDFDHAVYSYDWSVNDQHRRAHL